MAQTENALQRITFFCFSISETVEFVIIDHLTFVAAIPPNEVHHVNFAGSPMVCIHSNHYSSPCTHTGLYMGIFIPEARR